MSATDLMLKPVPELASLVRGGEIAAREVVAAALARIDDLDDRVNAFVEVDAERALEVADTIEPGDERPFAGVPIAIKSNVPVAGMCVNFGSRFLQGHRPGHNAYLVRRLRDAGFVVVGTTNMPEFGILPTTEPRHTGPTRNPWDLDRTPGGSSGGAAAAVAAATGSRRRRGPCRAATRWACSCRPSGRPSALGSCPASCSPAARRRTT